MTSTMVLISLGNFTKQTEDQKPFLVGPKKPQNIGRRNAITIEPYYNESTNDPQSPYNSDTWNTNQQNQTLYSSYYH